MQAPATARDVTAHGRARAMASAARGHAYAAARPAAAHFTRGARRGDGEGRVLTTSRGPPLALFCYTVLVGFVLSRAGPEQDGCAGAHRACVCGRAGSRKRERDGAAGGRWDVVRGASAVWCQWMDTSARWRPLREGVQCMALLLDAVRIRCS